ncbi:MAG: hypothetical protein ACFFC7_20140 [Candidatus Hermodarchaeota archaeon]
MKIEFNGNRPLTLKESQEIQSLIKLYCENKEYKRLFSFIVDKSNDMRYKDYVILTAYNKKIKPLLIGKQAENLLKAFRRIVLHEAK